MREVMMPVPEIQLRCLDGIFHRIVNYRLVACIHHLSNPVTIIAVIFLAKTQR